MRTLFLFAALQMITQLSFSQDNIEMLNGKEIDCTIIELSDSTIKYRVKEEGFIRNIASSQVHEIVFKSGKVEHFNNRIVVNSESEWEKVQIVNSDFDIEGFSKGEKIKSKVNSGWSTTNLNKIKSKALEKLKRTAASKGYPIVMILNSSSRGAHTGKIKSGIIASYTGVCYNYK